MTESYPPQLLFAKPGAIKRYAKATLKAAGIIVVEVEYPTDVKLLSVAAAPVVELSHGELLACAGAALAQHQYAREAFGKLVADALVRRHEVPA